MRKHTVRNAATRQAVCNDGSPAVYYFRKGWGTGADTWVLFLGGGNFCFSVETCVLRERLTPELMTSSDKPETLELEGIFSESNRENPDFYNANHVVIPYCSSDLWSGDRESSSSTGGYAFRGQKIVRSVVQDLRNKNGVAKGKLATASRVLLSGTSAGGAGVMMHLDWLTERLPGAEVRGVNDAGWIPESGLISQILPLDRLVEQGIEFWNGKGDASCYQANVGNEDRCYLSSVYPHIQTPLMVQMSQHDRWVLGLFGIKDPLNFIEQQVANAFADAVRKSLVPVNAAFSPRT